AHAIVEEALDNLGLASRAHQLAKTLSGGWKQRLALAACMLRKPRLLLLDEPTAGVDPSARRDFWDELHSLAAQGVSVLISTHYMDEAERCHSLAYIAYGNLLAKGKAQDIIAEQSLITYSVFGGELTSLSECLKRYEGVEQTVIFGQSLHVSGKEERALLHALHSACDTRFEYRKIATSLEDVFIYIMKHSTDNFGGGDEH
ncbi:MAG: ABC transporter ATP-binding protein, partial [Sulfuricurvum sp.]